MECNHMKLYKPMIVLSSKRLVLLSILVLGIELEYSNNSYMVLKNIMCSDGTGKQLG